MANVIDRQITLEGRRNVVIKWTGILDSSNVTISPALSVVECLNNDVRQRLTGFRLDLAEWSIASPLEVQLYWEGDTPKQILPLAGRGRISASSYGGYVPDPLISGYTGNIILVTQGYTPGLTLNFAVTCEFIKMYSV